MEKEVNHVKRFLDVLLKHEVPHFPFTSTHRIKTFNGVLAFFLVLHLFVTKEG